MNAYDPKPKAIKNEIEKGETIECIPFDGYVVARNQSLLDASAVNETFHTQLNADLIAILRLNPNGTDALGKSFYIFKEQPKDREEAKFMLIDEANLIGEGENPQKAGLAGEFSAGETLILGRNSGTSQRLGGDIDQPTISRNHVEIFFARRGNGVEITDLGSTNGTSIQAFEDKTRLRGGVMADNLREILEKIKTGELPNPIPAKSDEEILNEFTSSVDLHK